MEEVLSLKKIPKLTLSKKVCKNTLLPYVKYYNNDNVREIVSNFAKNAMINKLDGIVCSPQEIAIVKKITQNKLIIVTPGIRPINYEDSKDDQKRVMSPKDAIDAGANYLVMGRPITKSSNPLKSLQSINSSLE